VSTAAIVVNFNAGKLLASCVTDLLNGVEKPLVRVVDNASTDGSAERLRQLFGTNPGLEVLFNPGNVGFAPAVNAFARDVSADYLWVVNPDCRIPGRTLMVLREALDNHPEAALAAPAVKDGEGKPEAAAVRRFPTPWKSLMSVTGLAHLARWSPLFAGVSVPHRDWPVEVARVEAVSGACMLIRASAFREIGYLDEGYGLHCEDLDLMYRMEAAGWDCLFVPGVEITHEQGVSSRSRPRWVHRQKHLGMARFFNKFQASRHAFPVRWLVRAGIWAHWLLLLPWVMAKR
jgi:GT2 family glycosyltransferase